MWRILSHPSLNQGQKSRDKQDFYSGKMGRHRSLGKSLDLFEVKKVYLKTPCRLCWQAMLYGNFALIQQTGSREVRASRFQLQPPHQEFHT